jgi:NAD(P)-dependent dehydrogenase (short-subunit alcohol dehydrogenase family)
VEAGGRVVITDLDPTKAPQGGQRTGRDVLVSNAGIQIVHPIEEFPFADWKKMLAIHLDGAFLTTKACVKYMYKQNSGALILHGLGAPP